MTLFHSGAYKNGTDVISALIKLKNGPKLDAIDKKGTTALQ